ncbi:MAG: Asp-tRNA(Asn)/Glu-tRNA(Gln) amidotransferase subunit GatB [Candidatus Gracilibacteria bacterium]|nr:Asp-tRNA(Asn)/Glu-tRNA(Gln) amidotransferase subunit GatB [Candidatus Gracilibacteria bacterium]
MSIENYEKVIGLEIHVRVKSDTKFFCNCKNAVELATEPNINVCPVCMGFPGMLPSINAEVVRLGVKAGLLMNCSINKSSRFDRKSYFYPDLPNSFQITQMYETITGAGTVKVLVGGEVKEFGIHHMHLENDAGKLVHSAGLTLCDYNRAGSPLMEIVTDPVFYDKEEVVEFLKELQKMFRFASISDADMEKGQLRCDVNISIRKKGATGLGTRVELKNINSFSSIARAIDGEFLRQVRLLESGGTIDQETRGWDDDKGVSTTQRSKEDAMDYRYFPEPDLLPINLSDEYIEDCKKELPELPIEKRLRYLNDYKLSEDDARILTADKELCDYFEVMVKLTNDPKKSCSYITTILLALLNECKEEGGICNLKFDATELAKVIELVNKNEISSTNSKTIVEELFKRGGKTDEIIDKLGLRQQNNTDELEKIVDDVLSTLGSQIEEYKSGKVNLFGFFVGQCMKASKGKGNPKIFTDIIKNKIG